MVCQLLPRHNNYCCCTVMLIKRAFLINVTCIAVSVVCLIGYLHRHVGIQQIGEHLPYETIHTTRNTEQERIITNTIEIQSVGNIFNRVATFNAFLSSMRERELKERGNHAWQTPTLRGHDVIFGNKVDYLQLLSIYSNVKTVVLPWLINSTFSAAWNSNLLIYTYYRVIAENNLCSLLMHSKHSEIYKHVECHTNINDSVRPQSFHLRFHKNRQKFSSWLNNGIFYHTQCCTLFHMHVYRDAVVTKRGDVITGKLKLVLPGCRIFRHSFTPLPSNLTFLPLYEEIFVITQYWGNGYFHRFVEVLPRISLCLIFLKRNPQIRIMVPQVKGRGAEMLQVLGLNTSRLISGVARAKIVYQPRGTACGFANLPESQMLSQLYRDYIKRKFALQQRNKLILIRRSGSRRFSEQKNIESVLQLAARDYNLTYTLFIDNPPPSLKDTMMMFHSAVMIVAPHGAGLANLFFSQPGTFVIEGVCNPPHVNLCFLRLAHVLGHHYHGITSRRHCPRVVDVSAARIGNAVHNYLRIWKPHISS